VGHRIDEARDVVAVHDQRDARLRRAATECAAAGLDVLRDRDGGQHELGGRGFLARGGLADGVDVDDSSLVESAGTDAIDLYDDAALVTRAVSGDGGHWQQLALADRPGEDQALEFLVGGDIAGGRSIEADRAHGEVIGR
jgi:hypothetical protein